MMMEPYAGHELRDYRWLICQLEEYLLEQGHDQKRVNAWILAKLLQDKED